MLLDIQEHFKKLLDLKMKKFKIKILIDLCHKLLLMIMIII